MPAGQVAETPEEARAAAEAIGGRVVVKAQVQIGGRGKAGGIKLADDAGRGRGSAPATILGMDIQRPHGPPHMESKPPRTSRRRCFTWNPSFDRGRRSR